MARAADMKAKNSAMAAYMKQHNIVRHTCQCPMCHNGIGIGSYMAHVIKCKGSDKAAGLRHAA